MGFAIGTKQAALQAGAETARVGTAHRRPGAIGNQAALRRLSAAPLGVQPKLEIGAVDDPLEREADAAADQVMRMPDAALVAPASPLRISRKCATCEEVEKEKVQSKREGAVAVEGEAPTAVHEVLGSPGRPLDAGARAFFEPRFGAGFSDVRVHDDDRAAQATRQVGAQAFAVGNHIVFGAGNFAPNDRSGQELLAHELAHVAQQLGERRATTSAGTVRRQEEPAPAPTPAPSPGPTLTLAKPPHFPQTALTCWASAIASWQRVKGFVAANVTDQTLIDHYRGTGCVDSDNALVGEADSDVEAVYAEWRLQLKISSEVPEASWTFDFVKTLLQGHGHFVVATGAKSLMHSMVVYGVVSNDRNDPRNFTVLVEDPLASDNEKHAMFFERPIRIALGTESRAGPAPCRSRPPPPKE